MKAKISSEEWRTLQSEGHLRIPNAFGGKALSELTTAIDSLLARYPNGFVNPPLYSGRKPEPGQQAPQPIDRAPKVIIRMSAF